MATRPWTSDPRPRFFGMILAVFSSTLRPALRRRSAQLAVPAMVCCVVASSCDRRKTESPTPQLSPPNIVVLLSDTHRWDHGRDPAAEDPVDLPTIEALAGDGATFSEAFTPVPISAPAYASLMTGLRPVRHGLLNNQQHLSQTLPLLQERLQDLGYQTAAVVGNPFCTAAHGFGRGFDWYWDKIEGTGKEGAVISREAMAWIDGRAEDRPFFLFAAYMDAHTPYISAEIPPSLRVEHNGEWLRDERAENAHVEQRYELALAPGVNLVTLRFLDDGEAAVPESAPSPLHLKDLRLGGGGPLRRLVGFHEIEGTGYERIANRAVLEIVNPSDRPVEDTLVFRCFRKYRSSRIPRYYRAGVRSFDRAAGRLLDHLRSRGLYDDAVVIFLSDHGEMLGEHGAWGHVDHLYDPSLRIPLIVKAPEIDPGSNVGYPLDLCDVHDLILDLATGETGTLKRIAARAADAVLIGSTFPPEATLLAATARRGTMKVVVDAAGGFRLFDLAADPTEDSETTESERVDPTSEPAALFAAAAAELAEAATAETLDPSVLTDEQLEQLHALGYLDDDS